MRNSSQGSAGPPQDSNKEQQYDRPNERDEDYSRQAAHWIRELERPEDPPADKRATDSNDDVADYSESGAANYERRENAGH